MADVLVREIVKYAKSTVFVGFIGFAISVLGTSITIFPLNIRRSESFCSHFRLYANNSDARGYPLFSPVSSVPFEQCCKRCFENPDCVVISRSQYACYFRNETDFFERSESSVYVKDGTVISTPPSPPELVQFSPPPSPYFPSEAELLKTRCLSQFLCASSSPPVYVNPQSMLDISVSVLYDSAFLVDVIGNLHNISVTRTADSSWRFVSNTIALCQNPISDPPQAMIINSDDSFDSYCRYSSHWNEDADIRVRTDDVFRLGAKLSSTSVFFEFFVQYDVLSSALKFEFFRFV